MNKKICPNFEADEQIYCNGDCKNCSVCKWNNNITDQCMIGCESE